MADAPPKKTDVLVIGGGIAGCAVACALAEAGVQVLLTDRHDLNTLASGSNAGSIHAQIPQHEFLSLGEDWARGFAACIPLLMDSVALWRDLERVLETDLHFSSAGGVMVAHTDEQMRSIARKAEIERRHGLEVDILDRASLRHIAPYVADDAVGGSFCPIEGKADPLSLAPAFARRAEKFGAVIRRRTEILHLAQEADSFRVATSAGPVLANRVVNCAGADAARIAAMLGAELKLQGVPIQVNVTLPAAPIMPHLVYYAGGRLTLKQAPNGGFLIGGGWPATRDPHTGRLSVNPLSMHRNLHLAASVVPALADATVLRTWPAMVNGTADWRPILGELPGYRGFFVCCFPWIGFTAGPIAGRIVADMVLGRKVSPALLALAQ